VSAVCRTFSATRERCEATLSKAGEYSTNLAEAFARLAALQAPLNERLAAYRKHVEKFRPEFATAYDRLVARIEATTRDEIGPSLGSPMPEFVLPDEEGHLTTLESLIETGPAVISFNRGHWCPYCKLEVQALAAAHREIGYRGAQVVSIVPETASYTRKFKEENNVPFRILTDLDLSYALSLGLVFWVGPEVKKLYDDVGIDLARFQGNENHFLPITATFVVGPDGLVKARHVDHDYRQRMEIADILAAVDDPQNH
jgi:peroxiredoxin